MDTSEHLSQQRKRNGERHHFTNIVCNKFAIMSLLKNPPHPKHVASLPREIQSALE